MVIFELDIINGRKVDIMKTEVREINCQSAISKCGFPGGGWAINPYVGCFHNCLYCYGRFIKRFTGHLEPWGSFVDVRVNLPEVLTKQIKNHKFYDGQIYLSTVTDPYQPLEEKYQISRKVLGILKDYPISLSILTKSDLVLRDLNLLTKFKNLDVNFTINTLDEDWKAKVEPNSPSVRSRLEAAKKLTESGITVNAMMGPFWPADFTKPEKLMDEFKKAGIKHVFAESFNTTGGNFVEVEKMMRKFYPEVLLKMKEILFSPKKFEEFYNRQAETVYQLSEKYNLPLSIYFARGHAGSNI